MGSRRALLIGFFAFLLPSTAHSEPARAGIYRLSDARGTAPPTWGSQGDDRLIVAVDAGEQTLKAIVARRGGAHGATRSGTSSAPRDRAPDCAAYAADWPDPIDVTRWRDESGDGFCRAQLHVDRAALALLPTTFDGPGRQAELVEERAGASSSRKRSPSSSSRRSIRRSERSARDGATARRSTAVRATGSRAGV